MKYTTLILMILSASLPALAQTPVSISVGDVITAKVGFLGQFQFQSNTDPVVQGTSDNFVIRRARLIVGGTVGDKVDFLFDTDDPNLGKVASNVNGTKNLNNLYIQDAVLTYKFHRAFYLDCGLLTIDPSHNGLTRSNRLFGNDTFAYASLQNPYLGNATPTGTQGSSPLNREVGLSGRGLLGDHLEYHLGLTNGYRDSGNDTSGTTTPTPPAVASSDTISSNNAMRVTARVQYDLFDNEEAGYTTAGNYFGDKKIVSFGLGYDEQGSYQQKTADVFVDVPVDGGDLFTMEGAWWLYDGGAFLPGLLRQKDWSLQAGYTFKGTSLAPILRYESRRLATPGDSKAGTPINTAAAWTTSCNSFNEDRATIGFAWWIRKQHINFKLFYSEIKPGNMVGAAGTANGVNSGYRTYHQITAQYQVYAW